MKKAPVLAAILSLVAVGGCGVGGGAHHASAPKWPVWTVATFGVSLGHPAGWKAAPGYLKRLQGKSGYVSLNALQGTGLDPRAAAQAQAGQALSPFGAHPQLRAVTVDGQPGYVIMPSGGIREAEAVVLYPTAQTISGVPYRYLIVTAPAAQIMPIVRSVRFLPGKKH